MMGLCSRTVLVLLTCISAACGRIGYDALGAEGVGDDADPFAPDADPFADDAGPIADASAIAPTPFLRCDGVDDLVELTFPSDRRVRTLELRVRVPDPDNAPSTNYMVRAGRGSFLQRAAVGIDTNNPPYGLRANLAANDSSTSVSGGQAIGTDWMHVALVLDDSGPTARYDLYIDGQADVGADGPPSPLPDFNQAQLCGGLNPVFNRIDIDWVRISSIARYTGPFTPPGPALDPDTVVLLDFDDLTYDDRTATGVVVQVLGLASIIP